jgi:hypothetical protein
MKTSLSTALVALSALYGCSTSTSPSIAGKPDGAASEGGPPPITASDYSQSCQTPADCVLINAGDVCGCDGICGNAAINTKDEQRYESDFQARQAECPPPLQPCPACAVSLPFCSGGMCDVCHSPGCADGGVANDAGFDAASDATSE